MSRNTLIAELEDHLTELVLVAKELVELSQMSLDENLISDLQKKEDDLIKKITQLDQQVSKQYPELQVAERFPKQWKTIQKLLKGFETLNEQFIQNLSVRKNLVGMELKELRQQKTDLSKLKKVYVRPPDFSEKKGRVNKSV